jgi:peptidoglycan/LPS O-acetylase OafA/YrhL
MSRAGDLSQTFISEIEMKNRSLSIEEAFYLFFPLLCVLIRDARLIAGLCLIIFLAGPIARFHACGLSRRI